MIVSDVIEAVNEGKSPLILTERTDHIKRIAELLDKKIKNVIILRGGMTKKQRVEVAQRLDDIDDNEERVIVARSVSEKKTLHSLNMRLTYCFLC